MIKRTSGRLGVFLLILTIGLVISLVAAAAIHRKVEERLRNDFDMYSSERAEAIMNTLGSDIDVLRSIGALYASSESVDRKEFHTFANILLGFNPEIFQFRRLERVKAGDKEEFERKISLDLGGAFTIKDNSSSGKMTGAGRRDEYYPVVYVEPDTTQGEELGLDASGIPERWECLKKARDTGEPVISRDLPVGAVEGVKRATRVFLPIYANGKPAGTVEERKAGIAGFAVMLFDMGHLVERALKNIVSRGVDVYLYDLSAPAGQKLQYCHLSRKRTSSEEPRYGEDQLDSPKGLFWRTDRAIANAKIAIVCRPNRAFYGKYDKLFPWLVFASGIGLTLIVSLYIEMLYRGKSIAIREVSRKNMELKTSEERYKGIVDSQSELVTRFLPDGTFTFVNKACVRFFGKSEEQLLGGKFMPFIVAADIPRVMALVGTLSPSKNDEILEIRVYDGDGVIRWLQLTFRAFFSEAGTLEDIQGVGRDITDRMRAEEAHRESERKYKAIIDNTADLIIMMRLDGIITFLSPACEKVTGYPPGALMGKSIFSICADDPVKVRQKFSECLESGDRADIEFRVLTGEGRTKWVSQSISAVTEGGKIVFVSSVVRDITARKELEDVTATRLRDMEKFTKYTIGREKDIIRLKEEVNAILTKAGEPEKYLKGTL
ncbi:MAG: PAS domain S-box protein [Candidatus Omnitrophica bacterium]|nr:PAS domain S-box protein [Candidatus Omnitrophota bacterium]